MKLNKKQLRNLILKEINQLNEDEELGTSTTDPDDGHPVFRRVTFDIRKTGRSLDECINEVAHLFIDVAKFIKEKNLSHDDFAKLLKKEINPKDDGIKEKAADKLEQALRTFHQFM